MTIELFELDFPSFLEGSWIGEMWGQVIEIKNAQCSFEVSKNCPITKNKNAIILHFKGCKYRVISTTENTISWSDGDVWVRKTEINRRLSQISLQDLVGPWVFAYEDIKVYVDFKGNVRFSNRSSETYVLRRTSRSFHINIDRQKYPLLVTSFDGNRLCWKNLGIWIRDTRRIEEKNTEMELSFEYQHLGNPGNPYHKVSLSSLEKSMKINHAKDIVIKELKNRYNWGLSRSEIHLLYEGKYLSEGELTLGQSGLKSGATLKIITMTSAHQRAIEDNKEDKLSQQYLDQRWEAQQDKIMQSQPILSLSSKSPISPKFKLGSAGPTAPRTMSLGDLHIEDFEAEDDEESESVYSSELDEIDEKDLGIIDTELPTKSTANLLRRKTETEWTHLDIERMKNEMKEHYDKLQNTGKLIKGADLGTLELDALSGKWVGKQAKHNITIDASKGEIHFLDTKGCPFYRDRATKKIVMEYQKKKFEIVKIPLSMGEILWSDGDVWIRRPDENALSDPKNVKISELQGRYFKGVSKDEPCEIRGNVVNFRESKGCPLLKDEKGISYMFKNKKYTMSQVSPDRQKIFWDDKDVWYRDENIDIDYKSDEEFFLGDSQRGRRLNESEIPKTGWRSFSIRKFTSPRLRRVGRSRFSVYK